MDPNTACSEYARHLKIKKDPSFTPKSAFGSSEFNMCKKGTVGNEVMAVAVSTGGTPYKRPGRVGDTPLWGAGAYMKEGVGGCAATGYGEDLIRILATKEVVTQMELGNSPNLSSRNVINKLAGINGLGGVITMGARGKVGAAFNTPRMAFSVKLARKGAAFVGIEPEDLAKSEIFSMSSAM